MCTLRFDPPPGLTSQYVEIIGPRGCPACCCTGRDQSSDTWCQCLRCMGAGVVYESLPQSPVPLTTGGTDSEGDVEWPSLSPRRRR